MSTPIADDLNSVITSAVNARVEAAVAEALSGDAVIGRYIGAALRQEVEVKKPGGYGTVKTTFLQNALTEAFKGAAKRAIAKVLEDEQAEIEAAALKEIRAMAPTIAKQMIGQVIEKAKSPYGIDVKLKFPGDCA